MVVGRMEDIVGDRKQVNGGLFVRLEMKEIRWMLRVMVFVGGWCDYIDNAVK